MLTANELQRRYGFGHFLMWQALLRSVPSPISRTLARDKPCNVEPLYSIAKLEESGKTAQWSYNILLQQSNPTIPANSQLKWKRELALNSNFDWEKAYHQLYSGTQDFKLRWLQFRIWHRIIPTNARLAIYGIRETNDCDRCPGVRESIQHIFLHCPPVVKFWSDFRSVLEVTVGGPAILLNAPIPDSRFLKQVLYVLILLGKSYIWNCKQLNFILNIKSFTSCALDYISVERCISNATGHVSKFNRKWSRLVELLKNSERPP